MYFDGKDFDMAYTFYEMPEKKVDLITKNNDISLLKIPGSDFNIEKMKQKNSNETKYFEVPIEFEMLLKDTEQEKKFFEIPGSDFNQTNQEKDDAKLYDVKEGFLKGNMFKQEYESYNSYNYYQLEPRDKKEKILFDIIGLSFAINDLNLYLDLHPEDMKAYELFKNYIKTEKKICEEYTNVYGPLEITDSDYKTYEWLNNPWPWDNEGEISHV